MSTRNRTALTTSSNYPTLFPNDLLSEIFNDRWLSTANNPIGVKVDVRETDTDYIIDAEMPGLTKDDVQITVDNDVLTFSAHKEESKEEKDQDGRYLRRERRSGSFQRSFVVDNVQTDQISAQIKDGVLTITCPKKEHSQQPQSRKIDIQ